MKALFISCALLLSALSAFAQGYQFTEVVTVPATPVKNQAATGTCWCFATTSFMESELLRSYRIITCDVAKEISDKAVWHILLKMHTVG